MSAIALTVFGGLFALLAMAALIVALFVVIVVGISVIRDCINDWW